jgi:hypothetical protein
MHTSRLDRLASLGAGLAIVVLILVMVAVGAGFLHQLATALTAQLGGAR